jgi:type VI secretion system protein ImpH
LGNATDPLEFFRALESEPYGFDFFQTLRRIECLFPSKPRWGRASRPADEPVRLAQEPSLAFAPATLAAFQLATGELPARLEVRFLGLLGPNGPLPLHLTDYARERLLHAGDRTLARFLDVFNHRFLALFYRAWAQGQPTVSLDRPKDDRFATYVASLLGLGSPRLRDRDHAPDFAKLFYSGRLVRHARNSEGLAALLAGFFKIPVRIEQFVGHWMGLAEPDRTRLGRDIACGMLGRGAVLGAKVWDCQHKFRIWLGPLTLEQYENFLPGGNAIARLVAWVRQYLCFELEWDVRVILLSREVRDEKSHLRLGEYGRLGWTTWLGNYPRREDAADLILDCERLVAHGKRSRELMSVPA